MDSLNPFAKRVWSALVAEYPEWTEYSTASEEGDVEVAVPAPPGSNAGHLVVFTVKGQNLWLRFSPPKMCYAVDDEMEMLKIVRLLQVEEILFAVILQGDEWAGTTILKTGELPQLEPDQMAHLVSWSGKHDRVVSAKDLS
jgi:hypothetical protein